MRKSVILFMVLFWGVAAKTDAQDTSLIAKPGEKGAFPVVYKKQAATIILDTADYKVVNIAAGDLARDIYAISGEKPEIQTNFGKKPMIVVGTLGKSRQIDQLVRSARISTSVLVNKWEKFMITVIDQPGQGLGRMLLVIGSDKRGTAYGIYELSKQLGVSPWYWWADVPIKKSKKLMIKRGSYAFGPPSVKYRGIFINDENNGLGPWARKNFDAKTGKIGPVTYAKIYELMLRLKANVIWPAMKGPESFYQVPGNKELADRYGVFVGTSHHEPLGVNSSVDWNEKRDGPWQYETNTSGIKAIMDKRVSETASYDNVYTIGLRGNADLAMESKGGLDDRVNLMEAIFKDQRDILSKYHSKPVDQIPQVFTAYKEVLQILNNGLKVPDDVMLIWPDDNYGYIQQLNSDKQKQRAGGSGVYYHLNYVGRPMSAMWLSAPSPELIRKELNKAYGNKASKIWMFNVGDIKPYEFLISMCLDMAWQFHYNDAGAVDRYMSAWLKDVFGRDLALEIQPLFNAYYQTSFERKPEFMGWDRSEPATPVFNTEYSLFNYNEVNKRISALSDLAERVKKLAAKISTALYPAFFEMIYYPVVSADLNNRKFLYAQKNRIYAMEGRASALEYEKMTHVVFDSIKVVTSAFAELNNSKWKYMMQLQPGSVSVLPPLSSINLHQKPEMGVDYSGKTTLEGQISSDALPCFNKLFAEKYNIEIYNKGSAPFSWTITPSAKWIIADQTSGTCTVENKIRICVDWTAVPHGENSVGEIVISGAGQTKTLRIKAYSPDIPLDSTLGKFIEEEGAVSINAADYTRKNDLGKYEWQTISNLGLSGKIVSIKNDTLPRISFEWNLAKNAPSLEYDFYTYNQGWVDILSYTLPTHAISLQRGCLYGISVDGQPPQIIDFTTGDRNEEWKLNVERNAAVKASRHFLSYAGKHILKVWLIDTDVCFDKFIINTGGLRSSYLGPPETKASK